MWRIVLFWNQRIELNKTTRKGFYEKQTFTKNRKSIKLYKRIFYYRKTGLQIINATPRNIFLGRYFDKTTKTRFYFIKITTFHWIKTKKNQLTTLWIRCIRRIYYAVHPSRWLLRNKSIRWWMFLRSRLMMVWIPITIRHPRCLSDRYVTLAIWYTLFKMFFFCFVLNHVRLIQGQ